MFEEGVSLLEMVVTWALCEWQAEVTAHAYTAYTFTTTLHLTLMTTL